MTALCRHAYVQEGEWMQCNRPEGHPGEHRVWFRCPVLAGLLPEGTRTGEAVRLEGGRLVTVAVVWSERGVRLAPAL